MKLLTTRVTGLEMFTLPHLDVERPRVDEPIVIKAYPQIPLASYRALYQAVGRQHHWTSRLLPDAALRKEIHRDGVSICVMTVGGTAAGWYELESDSERMETRIVHFAILPSYRGRGLAPFMLAHAIRGVFEGNVRRLTIETNTLDHPAALPLYQRLGFRTYSTRNVETPSYEDVERRMARSEA